MRLKHGRKVYTSVFITIACRTLARKRHWNSATCVSSLLHHIARHWNEVRRPLVDQTASLQVHAFS